MSRSLLIINYFSAALAKAAVESARRASSEPLEVVIVDNSCDESELAALAESDVSVVAAPENLGYAGGINFGFTRCRGDEILVSNPDVEYQPGSIDHLFAALDDEVVLSGPLFTWDSGGEWLLPPAEVTSVRTKLEELFASCSPSAAAVRNRKRFHERVAFWRLKRTTRMAAVSGAVMAFRRDLFDRIGPFDERFRLYFEEIDFMKRIEAAGHAVAYVPDAKCRHLYNQSAGNVSQAGSLFAEAEQRFLEKWSAAEPLSLLTYLQQNGLSGTVASDDARPISPVEPFQIPHGGQFVVEASPLPDFSSAAGHFPTKHLVSFSSEIWASYRQATLFVRVVDAESGEAVARYSISRQGPTSIK